MSQGLSRRQFIKAGAAGAALVGAGAAGMLSFDSWIQEAKAVESGSEERIAYTFHQQTCGGQCSLKCTVRDGRLCLIEPNDAYADMNFSTACLRGLSEVQHVYSQERIQTPLKRVGERGSGEFVAVSWDEALAEVKEKIEGVWSQYGKEGVMVLVSNDARFPFMMNILNAQPGGFGGIDIGVSSGLMPSIGPQPHTYIGATASILDWPNSNTIINMGNNYLESSLVQSRYFFDAKDAGSHIITVDPHYSTTAAKSHEWVPIIPGTDGALVLGMITHIIEQKWYDEAFMAKHTSFPFLVNTADGTFLQDHAPDPAAAAPEPVSLNPYLVWDILSDSPQAYQAPTAQAALEGTHTIDGQEYKTVFTLVKENHAEYSIDWAAETTGIDASRIADLAMQYALKGPSCLTYGMGGVDKFYNAETLGHAMAVAAGLTGNIGKPGGSMGLFSGYANEWYATLGGWPLPEEMNPSPAIDNFVDLPYQENKVHAILTFGDKLFQWFANMNEARKWWTSLDFILYCDIYHSESADWADIILPACTKFEELEEIGGLRQAFGYYRLQEKVLDPLFDSKPDFWIEREIAKLWHLEDHLPATPADYVRAQLTNPTESFLEGVTLEKIRANQNVLPFPNCEGVRVAFEDHVFSTGSGRLEVYYPSLLSFGRQLPKWEPANEAYAGNELKNTYPIQLHGSRPKYYIHNQFHDAKWIQQYKEACVEMNPADLETRGLMPGDIVEIFNDRGTCSTKVVANSSIRPGSASIVEGTWSKFMDSGNMQALTNSARNPVGYATWMGPVTPFNDTLCEVRKAGTQS